MTSLSMRIALGLTIASGLIGLMALAALAGVLPVESQQPLIAVASSLATLQPPGVPLGVLDLGLALNLALVGGILLGAWLIRLFISH